MRIYKSDGSNADLCRRQIVRESPTFTPDTPGVEIEPSLLPDDATPRRAWRSAMADVQAALERVS